MNILKWIFGERIKKDTDWIKISEIYPRKTLDELPHGDDLYRAIIKDGKCTHCGADAPDGYVHFCKIKPLSK